jgi:hypothetical protein
MIDRRLLTHVAVAAGLVSALVGPVARAEQDSPASATTAATAPSGTPKKKPAPHRAAAKPKPAPAPKETPKHSSPESGGPAEPAKPRGAAPTARDVVEHESRIEFDERMVRGQSAAGAIFLFQRTPSDLKSIIEVPDGFRARTVEMLQSNRGTP